MVGCFSSSLAAYCVTSQKLDLIHNSPVTVGSYFSFADKEQDKSDHLISVRFTWSLSNEEILTPQLQNDGAVFFCVSLNFINNFTSTHVK